MSLFKKNTQKYNPIEERRKTARMNKLVKDNEELREKLAKTEYELDTKRMLAHSLEWSIKILDEKLQEKRDETEQLELKLIQANIRMERAKSYLSGNIIKEPEEAEQNTHKTQHTSDTKEAFIEREGKNIEDWKIHCKPED